MKKTKIEDTCLATLYSLEGYLEGLKREVLELREKVEYYEGALKYHQKRITHWNDNEIDIFSTGDGEAIIDCILWGDSLVEEDCEVL